MNLADKQYKLEFDRNSIVSKENVDVIVDDSSIILGTSASVQYKTPNDSTAENPESKQKNPKMDDLDKEIEHC